VEVQMDAIHRFELCLKELDLLQANIARYDGNGLAIKSWCITSVSVLGAYAVVHRSIFVALIATIATLAFALTEMVYRCYQRRFIDRSNHLEADLSNDLAEYHYCLGACAGEAHWRYEIGKALVQPHFWMLYAMLIVMLVLIASGITAGVVPELPKP